MPEAVVTTTNYGWSTVRKASSVDEQRDWYAEYIDFANEIDSQVYANEAKADAAQADATQAISDAAAAQTDATQALADSASAQSDATQALSDALDNAAEIVAISPIKLFGQTTTSTATTNTDILALTLGDTDYPVVEQDSVKTYSVLIQSAADADSRTGVCSYAGEITVYNSASGISYGAVGALKPIGDIPSTLNALDAKVTSISVNSNKLEITVEHTGVTTDVENVYWVATLNEIEQSGDLSWYS